MDDSLKRAWRERTPAGLARRVEDGVFAALREGAARPRLPRWLPALAPALGLLALFGALRWLGSPVESAGDGWRVLRFVDGADALVWLEPPSAPPPAQGADR